MSRRSTPVCGCCSAKRRQSGSVHYGLSLDCYRFASFVIAAVVQPPVVSRDSCRWMIAVVFDSNSVLRVEHSTSQMERQFAEVILLCSATRSRYRTGADPQRLTLNSVQFFFRLVCRAVGMPVIRSRVSTILKSVYGL